MLVVVVVWNGEAKSVTVAAPNPVLNPPRYTALHHTMHHAMYHTMHHAMHHTMYHMYLNRPRYTAAQYSSPLLLMLLLLRHVITCSLYNLILRLLHSTSILLTLKAANADVAEADCLAVYLYLYADKWNAKIKII